MREVVYLLLVLVDQFRRLAEHVAGRQRGEPLPGFAEAQPQALVQPFPALGKQGEEFFLGFDHQFRRGAGGRRAQVRDEIGDGEIDLVPDCRDRRDHGPGQGAGNDLFVERP